MQLWIQNICLLSFSGKVTSLCTILLQFSIFEWGISVESLPIYSFVYLKLNIYLRFILHLLYKLFHCLNCLLNNYCWVFTIINFYVNLFTTFYCRMTISLTCQDYEMFTTQKSYGSDIYRVYVLWVNFNLHLS